MYRLKYGVAFAHVGSRNDADSSDKPAGNIGDDVAIEIRQQQDVECFRPQDKLHGRVIDNQFLY
jgi:hypothetical protein